MTLEMKYKEKYSEGRKEGRKEERIESIQKTVSRLKKLNIPKETIMQSLKEDYNATQDEIKTYVG